MMFNAYLCDGSCRIDVVTRRTITPLEEWPPVRVLPKGTGWAWRNHLGSPMATARAMLTVCGSSHNDALAYSLVCVADVLARMPWREWSLPVDALAAWATWQAVRQRLDRDRERQAADNRV